MDHECNKGIKEGLSITDINTLITCYQNNCLEHMLRFPRFENGGTAFL
jgi:hypothetical protein